VFTTGWSGLIATDTYTWSLLRHSFGKSAAETQSTMTDMMNKAVGKQSAHSFGVPDFPHGIALNKLFEFDFDWLSIPDLLAVLSNRPIG